jgi:uncharacterized protein YutE (UPF0331/DUF86 family)
VSKSKAHHGATLYFARQRRTQQLAVSEDSGGEHLVGSSRMASAPTRASRIRLKTVATKAEVIREMLAGIQTLPLASEAEFSADFRMVAAGESFLRRSLQALLDLGRHVLSKGFGKLVPDYAAVAEGLATQGILSPESTAKLRLMARYRNRMVRFYNEIRPSELYGILTQEREDVEEILTTLQTWLADHPELCDNEL